MNGRNRKKRGFTLIELIVVMAVIGILVLLAAPRFIGQTKEAQFTKHINNAKVLEDAAERYYIDHGKWPRGADEDVYTAEQVDAYADHIYDITGSEISLDEGNFWDIDYGALETYAKLPDESEQANYILRNPVGKIFYLEGLTESGQTRLSENSGKGPEEGNKPNDDRDYNVPVVFHGLDPDAFDGDPNTYVSGVGIVTWEGELANREISVTGAGSNAGGSPRNLRIAFQNESGNIIKAINSTSEYMTISGDSTIRTIKAIVPEGAKQIVFSSTSGYYENNSMIYDVSVVSENTVFPDDITLESTVTHSSVTLMWDKPMRAIIHRDGEYIATVINESSYVDKPLYQDERYTYDVYLINEYGNAIKKTHTAQTDKSQIHFTGLGAAAFDGDSATYVSGVGTVTWEGDLANQEITITGSGSKSAGSNNALRVTFQDDSGNIIKNSASGLDYTTISGGNTIRTITIVVPDGAKKMIFSASSSYYSRNVKIYDIVPSTP